MVFHVFTWIFFTFYGFIFSKNWFDPYYILINLFTLLTNTMVRGECIISLIEKWNIDPTYKIGTSIESTDILNLFGKKYVNMMKVINIISRFFKAWSTYLVLKRMNYKYSIEAAFIILVYSFFVFNSYLFNGIFFILFLIISINIFNLKRL